MKSRTEKILEILIILSLTGFGFEAVYIYRHWPQKVEISEEPRQTIEIEKKETLGEPAETEKEEPFPKSFDLDVTFICQAPAGNWGPPFNHACEEATVLMVHYFLQKKEIVKPEEVSKEIVDLVDFETEIYGFSEDASAEQTAQLVRDYYGYKAEVYYDITSGEIKKQLIKGNPVIVPVAGRMLNNPYFTPPGPVYHMLVIKGWNSNGEFITNDPGTKRGADFVYPSQILEEAIHDWNGNEEDIENGRSAMIVIIPANAEP